MEKKAIIMRYSELFLKGRNRRFFENILIANIKKAVARYDTHFTATRSRYILDAYRPADESAIIHALTKVFGLHSLSAAVCVENDYDQIVQACKSVCRTEGSFRVSANRADKTFPMPSNMLAAELGGDLLEAFPSLRVDLHNPDFTVHVDMREQNVTYIFTDIVDCVGGMPVGSSGEALLMLSGGIDSPVSGYMMAKRGLRLKAIHFFSPPYTSAFAKQKAIDLAECLTPYNGVVEMYNVPFTQVQETIHAKCRDSFMIILMRRIMMRIANRIAKDCGCGAIVTGESLGQVASQTLESLTVTNEVSQLPVMRPLIGFDKEEIITIAKKIGTFDISIRPFDDCCTVFLPENPQTKPKQDKVLEEESKLPIEELIEKCLAGTEKILVKCGA